MGERVSLGIAHLRSYENMGTFEVACVEGCTCNSTVVDGINTIEGDKSSQTVFWLIEVSAAGGWAELGWDLG